ncbi:MAG: hypothetical protein JW783_05775 [Bacteroidales bacterium]|nr:hypothetical protein [Bacteroidales bacterium]MBN2749366.1 hypothetical protein [Bacteroidales bacterium]
MKFFTTTKIALVLLVAVFTGCAVSTKTKQLNTEGSMALQAGDYSKALAAYEEIITLAESNSKQAKPEVYQSAGVAAWNLKQTDKAIGYLEKVKQADGAVPATFSTLAMAYNDIDNLSKEINHLESYVERYPTGEEIGEVRRQLFIAYVESENWEPAALVWEKLDQEAMGQEQYLTGYLKASRKQENAKQCDVLAGKLIKLNKSNLEALEYLADKHYWLAENSYLREMKAYEKNRTNKQYKQLLAAFKIANVNYKTSRDYYEKLYKLSPQASYANYLGNIYTRLENKSKAAYYYKLSKK